MDPGLKLSQPDLSTVSDEERIQLNQLPYRSLVGRLIYLAIGTQYTFIKLDDNSAPVKFILDRLS